MSDLGQKRSFDPDQPSVRFTLIGLKGWSPHVDPSKSTVREFLARWLTDWAKLNLTPKTVESYSCACASRNPRRGMGGDS
jgi:hypothetical protein